MLRYFPFSLSVILLMLGWLIPNHYAPWNSFYNEFFAGFALSALATAVLLGRYPLIFPRSAKFLFLLAFVPLIQFATGLIHFLGDALMSGIYLSAFAFAIAIGLNLSKARGPQFVEGLAWATLVAAFISVVLALHQWLELQQLGIWLMDMRPGGRPYANLAQPNNFATLACIGLAAALYLRERGHFGRTVLYLLAFLLLAGVAMTRSRMAFFIMVAIAAWILWGRKKLGLKCSTIEVFAGLGVFVLLWSGWATLSEWLYLSADSTTARLGTSFGGEIRLVLWQQMIDGLSRQPWFGYGWNQVSVAQVAVAADHTNTVFTEFSHNLILDLLIWNGAILGGVVLAAAGWWLLTRMRRIDSLESWFALLVILVVGTHSLFEFPHAYAYFLLPVGLCIGIADLPHAANARLPRWAFAMATVFGISMLAWVFAEYQRIETDYRLMRYESAKIERKKPQSKAPDVVMLTQLREFIRFARTEAREEMSEAELDWMRKVAHRYAYSPALFRYALALGLNNRPLVAGLELRRLKQLYPGQFNDEVRPGWEALAKLYPQLMHVPFPTE